MNWDDGTWQYVWTAGTGSERKRHEPWCDLKFHLDLGCGRLKKARVGIDHYPDDGVDIVQDLSIGWLPFEESSIESVISHHFLEHLDPDGFVALVDEVYRILKPDGIFYAITPLFPSRNAIDDPTHKQWITVDTWRSFEGHLGDENNPSGSWLDSFSTPYTKARFRCLEQHADPLKPPDERWGPDDVREIRVVLQAVKRADVAADSDI